MNAFPTIMGQVFKQAGLQTPFLDEYVTSREQIFKDNCTDTLTRDVLKKLFITSLHGGDYFHEAKLYVPFLHRFQFELKSCTRKLLEGESYSHLKRKRNYLGSAILDLSSKRK